MTPAPVRETLTGLLLSFTLPEQEIQTRLQKIQHDLLAHSKNIREPAFQAIHPRDLEFLFAAYDDRFFSGLCRNALYGRSLRFRLSERMTRAGGKTSRYRSPNGELSFEIAIAISMLFDGFTSNDRSTTVCGLECANRLDALQRIFEHELVHLAEQICWETSDCGAARFQGIAKRFFLHSGHTHQLVTRRERAANSGIRIGSRVAFEFEGRHLTGRVNRITKRVTVLVEHPEGLPYSDGFRYKTYYVPIAHVALV